MNTRYRTDKISVATKTLDAVEHIIIYYFEPGSEQKYEQTSKDVAHWMDYMQQGRKEGTAFLLFILFPPSRQMQWYPQFQLHIYILTGSHYSFTIIV